MQPIIPRQSHQWINLEAEVNDHNAVTIAPIAVVMPGVIKPDSGVRILDY